MNEGWLELESDPGLFTLLVEEFGVSGVQVEEIYDLQKPIEGPVFGFIFLFKWIEERRARRKMSPADEAFVSNTDVVNGMFFAQQIVPNSCATHALLSVLLNCGDIHLGKTLTSLKTFSKNFTPESKGYAIGNVAQIAKVHNSHAHPEPKKLKEKQSGITTTSRTHDTFHFVSYVPINGRLFELDGLKPYPIDHGPWGDHEEWTEKFRRVIAERLDNEGGSSDIRFNLMAVVADRRLAYDHKLSTLRANKQVILDALEQLMHVNRPHVADPTKDELHVAQQSKKNNQENTKCPTEKTRQEQSLSSNQAAKFAGDKVSEKQEEEEIEVIEIDDDDDDDVPREDPGKKKKTKSAKVKIKAAVIPQPYRLPAALDNHNYAKSPLESDEESSSEYITESDTETTDGKSVSSSSSSGSSSSNSSSTETDSESSSDDKTEGGDLDVVPVRDVDKPASNPQQDKPDKQEPEVLQETAKAVAEAKPEDKTVQQESELPPPRTEGILKKQGAETTEKSDSPALRVTFCDAHEEKELDDDDIEIIDTSVPADISKPLTIQTVFENGPPSPASSNYSTDTASEAGSAFNSPIRSANHSRSVSPNSTKQLKFKEWKTNVITEARAQLEATILELDQPDNTTCNSKKIGAVALSGAHMGTRSKVAKAAVTVMPKKKHSGTRRQAEVGNKMGSEDKVQTAGDGDRIDTPAHLWNPPRPSFLVSQNGKQPFAPRDLLELLKSVESEIDIYEQKLLDETEKRNKYKVDDCRRTNNYDPFICTFLTMLAEQGKLSALVDKHTIIKRRQGVPLGSLQRPRKRDRRRPRSRPKKTKLK